jgi:hypothetical protein
MPAPIHESLRIYFKEYKTTLHCVRSSQIGSRRLRMKVRFSVTSDDFVCGPKHKHSKFYASCSPPEIVVLCNNKEF